jgi:hypothetical protein
MTAWLIGSATVILVILIVSRYAFPEFRRRSERPKYLFLANLGIGSKHPPNPQKKDPKDNS